jgi:uncharacterized protein DUF642
MAGPLFTLRRLAAVVAGALLLVLPLAGPAQAAGFADGSFEPPPTAPAGAFVNVPSGGTVGPWLVSGSGGVDVVDSGYWQAQSGAQSVDLNGSTTGDLCQTFDTVAGFQTISFYESHNPDGAPAITSGTLGLFVNGSLFGTFVHNTPNTRADMKYEPHSVTVPVSAGSTTLCFESFQSSSIGPVIDNVQLSAFGPACTRTVTGSSPSSIIVKSGEAVCLDDAQVGGSVTVQPGGSLQVFNDSTITGALNSTGATSITVCRSDINGTTTISGTTGPVILGDDDFACFFDRLAAVTLRSNTGGFELFNDSISGTVTAQNNTGTEAEIERNQIAGGLNCSGNNAAPTNDGLVNTVTGARTGQCAAL